MIQENDKDIRCAYCGLIQNLDTDNVWFDTCEYEMEAA